jgi:hypothetical protein
MDIWYREIYIQYSVSSQKETPESAHENKWYSNSKKKWQVKYRVHF